MNAKVKGLVARKPTTSVAIAAWKLQRCEAQVPARVQHMRFKINGESPNI